MAEKHTHKYQMIRLGKNKQKAYRCMLPDCNHYVYPEFIEGKRCVCYICNNEFIITPYAAKLKRPHCDNCVAKGEKKPVQLATEQKRIDNLILNFREKYSL